MAEIFTTNFSNLYEKDYLLEFIPSAHLSIERKVNAIVRFSFYLSIVLMIARNDYRYSYIFIATIAISYFFYNNNVENFKGDNSESAPNSVKPVDETLNVECDKPTSDNPFMNPLLTDKPDTKKKACNYTKEINADIDTILNEKLYKDMDTVYNSDYSQRQFYSMPNTQIPNDQGTFAKWLYSTPVACTIGKNTVLNQHKGCSMSHVPLNEFVDNDSDFMCVGATNY